MVKKIQALKCKNGNEYKGLISFVFQIESEVKYHEILFVSCGYFLSWSCIGIRYEPSNNNFFNTQLNILDRWRRIIGKDEIIYLNDMHQKCV